MVAMMISGFEAVTYLDESSIQTPYFLMFLLSKIQNFLFHHQQHVESIKFITTLTDNNFVNVIFLSKLFSKTCAADGETRINNVLTGS